MSALTPYDPLADPPLDDHPQSLAIVLPPGGPLGLTLGPHSVLSNVVPGGTADSCGLCVGDRLTALDGVSVAGWSTDKVLGTIKAGRGGDLHATFERGGIYTPPPPPVASPAPSSNSFGSFFRGLSSPLSGGAGAQKASATMNAFASSLAASAKVAGRALQNAAVSASQAVAAMDDKVSESLRSVGKGKTPVAPVPGGGGAASTATAAAAASASLARLQLKRFHSGGRAEGEGNGGLELELSVDAACARLPPNVDGEVVGAALRAGTATISAGLQRVAAGEAAAAESLASLPALLRGVASRAATRSSEAASFSRTVSESLPLLDREVSHLLALCSSLRETMTGLEGKLTGLALRRAEAAHEVWARSQTASADDYRRSRAAAAAVVSSKVAAWAAERTAANLPLDPSPFLAFANERAAAALDAGPEAERNAEFVRSEIDRNRHRAVRESLAVLEAKQDKTPVSVPEAVATAILTGAGTKCVRGGAGAAARGGGGGGGGGGGSGGGGSAGGRSSGGGGNSGGWRSGGGDDRTGSGGGRAGNTRAGDPRCCSAGSIYGSADNTCGCDRKVSSSGCDGKVSSSSSAGKVRGGSAKVRGGSAREVCGGNTRKVCGGCTSNTRGAGCCRSHSCGGACTAGACPRGSTRA